MKKYLLFGGEEYYAKGGVFDLILEDDSLEKINSLIETKSYENTNAWGETRKIVQYYLVDVANHKVLSNAFYTENNKIRIEWCQIVDSETMKVIIKHGEPYG